MTTTYSLDATEEWFTLESIVKTEAVESLYCIAVASPHKQFLAGQIGVPTHNTEEGKNEDQLKGEAAMLIGSIVRLGRAAGVHLVIATQRPDATIIAGETKANLGVRINCGRTDPNASSMILGSSEGARVRANPRGRLYLRIFSSGNHGQGFFADSSWLDDYLARNGKNPNGTPISQARSQLANLTDFNNLADNDLDQMAGVDNASAIESIRQAEAQGGGEPFDSDEEWGFDPNDETEDTEDVEEAPAVPTDRPILSNGLGNTDKFKRPEEDWDNDLEGLIEDNFD